MKASDREVLNRAIETFVEHHAAEQKARQAHEQALDRLTESVKRCQEAAAAVLALVPRLAPLSERHYWYGYRVLRLRRHEGAPALTLIDPE